jgi:hypothetical protein
MPNQRNIKSPIILISPGRSGTTLISDVFDKRPECSSCGETVDLIFDLWNAAQRSQSHISSEQSLDPSHSQDSVNAEFVRQGFLALLSDDKSLWFQKPIGIPVAFSASLFDVASWEEKARTYWHVMNSVFPDAKYFTILRHPCDVVMSFKRRFAVDEKTCWAILGFLAYIISHPDSRVQHAISYDALVGDSESTLKSLLSYLEVDFCSEMIDSFQVVHSWHNDVQSSNQSEFSWKRQWGELDPACADARFVEAIKNQFAKFGFTLQLPDTVTAAGNSYSVKTFDVSDAQAANECTVERLRERISTLEMEAASLNASWDERAIRQENDFHHAYKVLSKQIKELTEDKLWLEQQYISWQQVAEKREQMILALEKEAAANAAWRQEQIAGQAWQEQEIKAWENATRSLESRIDAVFRSPVMRLLSKLGIVRWVPPTSPETRGTAQQRVRNSHP